MSNKKKNKRIMQEIGDIINVGASDLDASIVNNMNAFQDALHGNGTRQDA